MEWLENEEGSDVTFSVGGERFHAHKLVLAARSTAFETEFFNGMVWMGLNLTNL